jgi:radical SAM protein with 4Fe4S-binding SPASM domain
MKPNIDNIIFEITQNCNLNCKFCYNIWKLDDKFISKTKQSYLTSLNTIKQLLKITNLKSITFTGGEPLLADRFIELVLFCRLQDLDISIISNGNTYSLKEYILLKDMGVNLFQFTLLSYDSKIHDSLTKTLGSWNKVIKSIKEVISLNKTVSGIIVITKENFLNIDKTLQLYLDLGVDTVMLNRFNIGGEGIKELNNILPSKVELIEAFKTANSFAENHNIILSSNVCTPWCILNPLNFPNIQFIDCANTEMAKPYTIDFEGNFRICNHSPKVIGNIFDQKIELLLNNDYIESWEKIIPTHCSNCKIYNNCKGGCRGASEQMGLSLYNVDPIINYYDKSYDKN